MILFQIVSSNERKRKVNSLVEDKIKEKMDDLRVTLENRRNDVQSFQSLINLMNKVKSNADMKLKNVISNHSYVGTIDREFSLIQHNTSLFIANTPLLTKQLFYQIVLKDFGNFGVIRFDPPAPINELTKLALDDTGIIFSYSSYMK